MATFKKTKQKKTHQLTFNITHPSAHCSVIYSRHYMEATQVPING